MPKNETKVFAVGGTRPNFSITAIYYKMPTMKNKKRKPLLRSQKILLAMLFIILAIITSTALFSCTKATAPVVVVDGWNMHYDVPVDTCGVGR
jgi:hypothetical protein